MTDHPIDDLASYALGVLDEGDAARVSVHVRSCPSCSAEVRALAETAWTIAEAQGRDAPGGIREAIVGRARADRRRSFAALLDGLRRPVAMPAYVAVGVAAVLVIALVGYGGARRDADRYAAVVSETVGATVTPLAATGAASGIRGSLVVPANGAAPYLILDLPSLPVGKTWEAWVIRGDTPVRAGISDAHGLTTLTLEAPLASGDVVAVTAEPAGGVDKPTGSPVLAGKS
jgi:anti-sigma-K factor RskA